MDTTPDTATMIIWIKQSGQEAEKFSAKLSDTLEGIKTQLSLQNVSLRKGKQHLGHSKTLEENGVAAGDLLTVHPNNKTPPGFANRSEYQAASRLSNGTTQKTTQHKQALTHRNLHQDTQLVMMQESNLLANKINDLDNKIETYTKATKRSTVPLATNAETWIKELNAKPASILTNVLKRAGLEHKGKSKLEKCLDLAKLDPYKLRDLLVSVESSSGSSVEIDIAPHIGVAKSGPLNAYMQKKRDRNDDSLHECDASSTMAGNQRDSDKKDTAKPKAKAAVEGKGKAKAKDKAKDNTTMDTMREEKQEKKQTLLKPDTLAMPAKKRQKRDVYNQAELASSEEDAGDEDAEEKGESLPVPVMEDSALSEVPHVDFAAFVDRLSAFGLTDMLEQKTKVLKEMVAKKGMRAPSEFLSLATQITILKNKLVQTDLAKKEEQMKQFENLPAHRQPKSAMISLKNKIEAERTNHEKSIEDQAKDLIAKMNVSKS
jgi:hypothetical protein